MDITALKSAEAMLSEFKEEASRVNFDNEKEVEKLWTRKNKIKVYSALHLLEKELGVKAISPFGPSKAKDYFAAIREILPIVRRWINLYEQKKDG